jgi:hypothetical protein
MNGTLKGTSGTFACANVKRAQRQITRNFSKPRLVARASLPAPRRYSPTVVVNAKLKSVFCSISCALADPVAGLALADLFTARTFLPFS